ncbi:MFS transporter [Candidatus Microgenomates bacterium]|jgi:MFS family permease|nr:MAG: MFS transporter [Candidatus Microgenomates bacterium]
MRINNLIKYLTLVHILLVSGWSFIAPIFAIFITQQIEGGTLELVGFATAANFLTRSVFQLPFARFIDRKKGEMDDFVITAIGSVLVSLVPFLHVWADKPVHLLLFQAIMGLGWAMSLPGWQAIFTRHIDHDREAEEWAICNTLVGFSIALAGALGAFLAESLGFDLLFMVVGTVTALGCSFLFFVYQDLRTAEKLALETKRARS